MRAGPATDGVRSVTRSLAILSAMTKAERREWTLDEISRSAGLAKSTAHRLLETLAGSGFIEPGGRSGTYRLGLEAAVVGSASMRMRRPEEGVHNVLLDLRAQTDETVGLAILSGDHAVTLDRALGSHTLNWNVTVGAIFPAHSSAGGKMLLASLPRDELERLYEGRGRLPVFTPTTIPTVERLFAHLEQVRAQGYAVDDEEFRVGLRCIGVAVRRRDGSVSHVLGVTSPASRMSVERLKGFLPLIERAAADVAAYLDLDGYE